MWDGETLRLAWNVGIALTEQSWWSWRKSLGARPQHTSLRWDKGLLEFVEVCWLPGLWSDYLLPFLRLSGKWTWYLCGPFDIATMLWRLCGVFATLSLSEPFRIICREAALSLETSISRDLFVILATTMAMFSPCWRASLEAINSASQVDLAIRSCLLDRHWTRLPPFFWFEVIPWYTTSPCWLLSPVGAKEASPSTHNFCLDCGSIGTHRNA